LGLKKQNEKLRLNFEIEWKARLYMRERNVPAFRVDGNVSPLASRAYLTALEHKIVEMKGNSSSTSVAGALFSSNDTRLK